MPCKPGQGDDHGAADAQSVIATNHQNTVGSASQSMEEIPNQPRMLFSIPKSELNNNLKHNADPTNRDHGR